MFLEAQISKIDRSIIHIASLPDNKEVLYQTGCSKENLCILYDFMFGKQDILDMLTELRLL